MPKRIDEVSIINNPICYWIFTHWKQDVYH